MKTWQPFSINLSNNLSKFLARLIAGVLLGLPFFFSLSSSSAFAQNGFYSNFKKLIDIQETNYNKKMESLAGSLSQLNDLLEPKQAELDPDFVSSMLFHTPSRYASLGGSDKCGLYDLILSNLAQGPNGQLERFIVRYKTKEGVLKTVATDRTTFFEKIAFKQCPQVEKFQAYFSLKNLPRTLKTVNLQTPVSADQCKEIHQGFAQDPKTPYLCYLAGQINGIPKLERLSRTTPRSQYRKLQKIKREIKIAKRYQELLNPASVDYLNSLCSNIESSKAFCDGFFNASFWQRVVNGERSTKFMELSCRDLLDIPPGKKLSTKNYALCARNLDRNPSLCRFLGAGEGALTPKPDCETLSSNLNMSRLKADYVDCPGRTANPAVVNVSRLINHFSNSTPPESESCHASTTAVFSQFNQETAGDRFWNVGLCYEDKIKSEEVCLPVVYGDVKGNPLSLSTAVEKILRRTKGLGQDQKCDTISTEEYRPELLGFKSGCFVIIDRETCYGTSCEFRVLLDQREITHIKRKFGTSFDYLPKDFANENFAQTRLLEQKYELRSARVMNVSLLKRALNKYPNGLIHGVGCAEDLLPEHFSKRSFNQCSPVPFIIDGYKSKNGLYAVSLRTGYDSLQAPRLVPWSHLFSSLKDYQRLHPLNMWGLNVIH